MSKFFIIGTLWVILLAGTEPCGAVAAAKPDRLLQEAIAFFRSIVKRETGQMDACALADRWDDYPIPAELARRHLGMKLQSDLVGQFTGTTPAEIIDPEGVTRQSFCSKDEAERQEVNKLEDFRTGVLKIDKGPYDLFPRLTRTVRQYTFPVFDSSYRRAVIVTTQTSHSWFKDSDGKIKWLGLYLTVDAVAYAKHGRRWQREAEENLAHGE